ncbi:hypothetical protein E3N88_40352 [Mikania micrantha]|uniref:Uncharacterized protein n=1 Tax=Mikania micrantha TaxID=192012 RepID=A0A5N6LMH5_9ASTR|nr:hypothetical protein E3N88_40352 [Mikania micrantha]
MEVADGGWVANVGNKDGGLASRCGQTLVQELTGNGSHLPATSEPTHVIQIDDHGSPDPSLSCSPDPSLDNMFMPFDYSNGSSEEFGLQWSQDDRAVDYVNEFELRNLESWLLDFDSSGCIHDEPFAPMNAYEYDYA